LPRTSFFFSVLSGDEAPTRVQQHLREWEDTVDRDVFIQTFFSGGQRWRAVSKSAITRDDSVGCAVPFVGDSIYIYLMLGTDAYCIVCAYEECNAGCHLK